MSSLHKRIYKFKLKKPIKVIQAGNVKCMKYVASPLWSRDMGREEQKRVENPCLNQDPPNLSWYLLGYRLLKASFSFMVFSGNFLRQKSLSPGTSHQQFFTQESEFCFMWLQIFLISVPRLPLVHKSLSVDLFSHLQVAAGCKTQQSIYFIIF